MANEEPNTAQDAKSQEILPQTQAQLLADTPAEKNSKTDAVGAKTISKKRTPLLLDDSEPSDVDSGDSVAVEYTDDTDSDSTPQPKPKPSGKQMISRKRRRIDRRCS